MLTCSQCGAPAHTPTGDDPLCRGCSADQIVAAIKKCQERLASGTLTNAEWNAEVDDIAAYGETLAGMPWISEDAKLTEHAVLHLSGRAGCQRELRVHYGSADEWSVAIPLSGSGTIGGAAVYSVGSPSCRRDWWATIADRALEALDGAWVAHLITRTEYERTAPLVKSLPQ